MTSNLFLSRTSRWIVALAALGAASCSDDRQFLVSPPNKNLKPLPMALKDVPTVEAADTLANQQWALKNVHVPEDNGNRRVTVAVVGTGMDYNHEDLRANAFVNLSENKLRKPGDATPIDGVDNDDNGYPDDIAGWDVVDNDGLPYDRIGTGTAAAGVIGAVQKNGRGIRGVIGTVTMIPVRYIGLNGQATVPALVKALDYVRVTKPDVVFLHLANVSFSKGIGESSAAVEEMEIQSLNSAMKKLSVLSIPIVVSAGNSGVDIKQAKPMLRQISDFPNVAVVTSVDRNDKRPFLANFGMTVVDIAAPGEGVLTTLPGDQYGEDSGAATHLAGAHVAGALALAISNHFGRVDTAQLLKTLTGPKGGDPVSSLAFETLSGTRLNVASFLAALP